MEILTVQSDGDTTQSDGTLSTVMEILTVQSDGDTTQSDGDTAYSDGDTHCPE